MVTKSLSQQWLTWSNMSLSYEANHIDSANETSHCCHVSLQSLQRNNNLSGTYAKWLCSIHLSCGKLVSLVNGPKLILTSVIKLGKHAKWLSSSNANWLYKPTSHLWKSCKSGQWSQIYSNLIESADRTSHLHHVRLKSLQRNNIWYCTNANRLQKPTHACKNCKPVQWSQIYSKVSD